MNVDKYTLYDERGNLLDILAVGYHPRPERVQGMIDEITEQINLVEGVEACWKLLADPRTAEQLAADEDAKNEQANRRDLLIGTLPF